MKHVDTPPRFLDLHFKECERVCMCYSHPAEWSLQGANPTSANSFCSGFNLLDSLQTPQLLNTVCHHVILIILKYIR